MSLLFNLGFQFLISAPILQEGIEVRVGGRIITISEIDEAAEKILIQKPVATKTEIRNQARQQLIERAAMEEYLAKFQMETTDRDITQRINLMMSSNGMKSQEDFRKTVERQFGNFEQFREDLRWQMNRARFYDLASRNISKEPSALELKEFFQKNRAEISKLNFEVTLAECLVPAGEDLAKTQKLVEGYVRQPKTFDDCVKTKSVSPSKDGGRKGELGRFGPGSLAPDLEAKIFALKKGQAVSIPSPNGFQILKVIDKVSLANKKKSKNAEEIDFESVKSRVKEMYQEEAMRIEADKLLASIVSDLNIRIQNKGA